MFCGLDIWPAQALGRKDRVGTMRSLGVRMVVRHLGVKQDCLSLLLSPSP